jgi:primosomal protein N' (replication factor Y)
VQWQCPHCGRRRLWAWAIGARRTAEELGRAFPSVPVVTSGRDATVAQVPDRPALVVATPGAEPDAEAGYAAALLLDGAAMLARADLRVAEETLRRWLNAAALVRPASTGGRVVVMAPSELSAVQALVRWDPAGFAARELAERRAASLPPAVRVATVQGSPSSVDDVLRRAALPAGVEVLGPLPVSEDQVRAVVRGPLDTAAAFVAALRAAQGERSARKEPEHVRLQVDPAAFG